MGDGQLLLGSCISVVGIMIQALATLCAVRMAQLMDHRLSHRRRVTLLISVVSVTGILLTAGHLLEVAAWAKAYEIFEVSSPENAYYLAFVNFTTLGYGDVLPAPHWRLLGPMTAANGMLLFGWSTAVIFAVLQKALEILRMA